MFGLWVFVRECLQATFMIASVGIVCIWTGEPMKVVAGKLLPIYFWLLPIFALGIYLAIGSGKMKYKHAYSMVVKKLPLFCKKERKTKKTCHTNPND